ncbi:hypothetical protein AAFF_G00076320, partial [Aldrovandia affinis]
LFTDLTNVGIVYELAQRLGVHELVHTCQATFPNLRGVWVQPGEQVVDLDLDLGFTTPAQQLSGKSLPKEFQAVRVHLLAHACLQPQPSLGARCACSFLARPLLERHMVLHAEDGGGLGPQGNGAPALLRCSLCPHVFHFASSFQLHLSQHASKPFQCKVCLRFFRKRSTMIDHLKTHAKLSLATSGEIIVMSIRIQGTGHGASLLTELNRCRLQLALFTDLTNVGVVYELAQRLGVHELVHTCQATFPNLRGLGPARRAASWRAPAGEAYGAARRGRWRLGAPGQWCPLCPHALLRCSLCPHVFHFASSFQLHLSQHASKPFQCKVCLRFFRKRSTMIGHLKTHAKLSLATSGEIIVMSIRIQGTGHGASLLTELNRCRLQLALFTDLTNVGIVYELAQRLGVHELVHTCQATFPNLRGSGSSPGEQVVDLDLDLGFTTPAQQLSGKSLPKNSSPSPLLAPAAPAASWRPLLERHMVLHAEDGGGLGPQGNGAPALLRCSLCPHVFHFASSFQLHLSQHASKPFQCKVQCKVCLRFFISAPP